MALSEEQIRQMRRAHRILEAAAEIAERADKRRGTYGARSSIEQIQLHDGWAGNGGSDDLIATGDWNTVTQYNNVTRQQETIDDTSARVGIMLEKLGFELEWCDEHTTCDGCGKLLSTSPDHYGWTPQYVSSDSGETLCTDCLDPEEHLRNIEGNPRTANTVHAIDPSDHGYFRFESDLETGWHPGQDADPRKIAKALEKRGVTRFLFQIDDRGQFDTRFSVWVHEDERELVEGKDLEPSEINGPSNNARLDRQLQEAASACAKLDGEGIKYAKISEEGVTARLVSREEFIEGIKD